MKKSRICGFFWRSGSAEQAECQRSEKIVKKMGHGRELKRIDLA
jgi:hypothetical protein